MTGWRVRAEQLSAALREAGVLTDAAWLAAFEQVPRHVFVPRFHRSDNTLVDSANPADREEWIRCVYSDISLTTKLALVPGTHMQWPVCSSTMPSLTARMLHLLQVDGGSRVLEIGTGTGYGAGLLCHRLGSALVTSIDVDADLVATATTVLSTLGYHPQLATGDGAAGVPDGAPYERIIATAAVATIPPAWINQLTPHGLIVADVRGEISSSLIALGKIDERTVRGRFLPWAGHFMWLRARADNPLRYAGEFSTVVDLDSATRHTPLTRRMLSDPDLRFVVQRSVPDAEGLFARHDATGGALHLRTTDGSWAELRDGPDGGLVTEGGPRPVWHQVELAAAWWHEHGRPTRSRFGLTATTAGRHTIWLDEPSRVCPQFGTFGSA